jgi:hypothetical protein
MVETATQLDTSVVTLKGLNWPVDGLIAGAQLGAQIPPTATAAVTQENFEPTSEQEPSPQQISEPLDSTQMVSPQQISEPLDPTQAVSPQQISEPLDSTQAASPQQISEPLDSTQAASPQQISEPLDSTQALSPQQISEPLDSTQVVSPQQISEPVGSTQVVSPQQISEPVGSTQVVSPQQTSEPTPAKLEGPVQSWSLKEAADNLGISINTVRKRLQQGTLEGFKVDGPYGPEWRISPPGEKSETQQAPVETPTVSFEGVSATVVEEEPRRFVKTYEEPPSERLLKIVETQLELMGRMQSELAMKDRLLMEKEGELKLLATKKPKQNWWQWLFGVTPNAGSAK